ncbi:hypothetical protein BRY73_02840 [Ochrobactrum sp. P6BS-III]|nr:hypothetical protein BRY73_02840 [Ochrobactrum sp. P6BS-III]
MPWVKFTEPFVFKPTPQCRTVYPVGFVGSVTTTCAAQAVEQGKAERIKTPRKGEWRHTQKS